MQKPPSKNPFSWFPDLFSRVLFSFLPPLLATPLALIFSPLFRPFLPLENALFCRAKGTPQSLERGGFRTDPSPDFGKEIPSRNLRKKRSVSELKVIITQNRHWSLAMERLANYISDLCCLILIPGSHPSGTFWPHIARYCNTIAAIPHVGRYFLREVSTPPERCDTPPLCT